MGKITARQVIDTLEEIVAQYGEDYTYKPVNFASECRYSTPEGEPDCIVGQVVYRLVPDAFQKIVAIERENKNYGFGVAWDDFHGSFPQNEAEEDYRSVVYDAMEHFDSEANCILTHAQRDQDCCEAWGSVLDAAREALKGMVENA